MGHDQAPSTPPQKQKLLNVRITRGAVALLVICILAVLAGIYAGFHDPLLGAVASREGQRIDVLFNVLIGISTAILIIVDGTLVYMLLRFRKRSTAQAYPARLPENRFLEIIWTVIPICIVTFLAVYSYVILMDISQKHSNPIVVEVTARQWEWQFHYPDANVSSYELYVPVNHQILLRMHSLDVIHSLWVPRFRVKEDVMPDRVTELIITPDVLGSFELLCNRICGVGHSTMRTSVIVQSEADFAAWLAQKQATVAPTMTAAAAAP
jgi:cytochrome c oxidase subunit 2